MKRILVLAAVVGLVLAAQAGLAGNKQLMTEKMAEQDLKRNIVEAVIGYKVRSESRMGLTEDPSYKAETKAAAVIKGIKIDKMIYDKDKDIALCFGHIELGDVVNVVGDLVRFKGVTVEGFGFGTMTEAARPPLMALRAAVVNAHDELAKLLVGEKILSQSTMENFILTKDVNRSKVCAAIFGAYIPNPGLNSPNRGWGWDETGNAFVKLEVDARKVRDVLGNLIIYKGPNIIEVTGRGSQTDDLSGDTPGSMVRDSGSKTKYMSIDAPTAPAGGETAPKTP
ncbi:hypothetical protein [Desulfolutivibrio sulfoxidireducens]|uniref:hypothetical protein n=1 Tax=Desulfolutivibrio sulfoxidireducens TaxID=2773299 RepID=UPI00159CFD27|nr:hypothetical protein [Desulfolutivibrio sulfoxidireducens]QLA15035.1 hypothetical protein GD605_02175 [Desulfolutivibrio sulfoxidireducens]QLA18604.1 hypothetical protein GD604_02090 [Desulfolutivibrio sulfoxidireducens]